jgi:hypothetical protein
MSTPLCDTFTENVAMSLTRVFPYTAKITLFFFGCSSVSVLVLSYGVLVPITTA